MGSRRVRYLQKCNSMELATIQDRTVCQACSVQVPTGCRNTRESLLRTTPEPASRIMRVDLEMLSCGHSERVARFVLARLLSITRSP